MSHVTSMEDFRKEMENESSDYLLRIWEVHNTDTWSENQLDVVSKILQARGVNLPKPAIPDSLLREKILLATTHSLEGKKIKRYLGVVSCEVALGTGFLTELDGELSDMFGAKATGFQRKLQEAKKAALVDICRQTNELEGNAIIGLDFDFMTLPRNILMVSANGTAVEIETE